MIYCYGGDIGSGKTLHSLSLMEEAVKAGRPVATNIELLPECPYFDDVMRLDDPEGKWPVAHQPHDQNGKARGEPRFYWHFVPPGSLIVIDEADIYFDCADHGRFAFEVKAFHKQCRKLEMDIIYITQSVENLYVRIRRLASRHILCEHNLRTQRLFRYIEMLSSFEIARSLSRFLRAEFGAYTFSPSSYRGSGHFTYREATRFFGWYRTKQLLGDTSFYRWAAIKGLTPSDEKDLLHEASKLEARAA